MHPLPLRIKFSPGNNLSLPKILHPTNHRAGSFWGSPYRRLVRKSYPKTIFQAVIGLEARSGVGEIYPQYNLHIFHGGNDEVAGV